MALLPNVLKVGPYTYRVRASQDRALFGSTNNNVQRIRIASWARADQRRATLLHESLHAVLHSSGAARALEIDDVFEERLIRLLEPWLLGLLRDNPDLVEYLLD